MCLCCIAVEEQQWWVAVSGSSSSLMRSLMINSICFYKHDPTISHCFLHFVFTATAGSSSSMIIDLNIFFLHIFCIFGHILLSWLLFLFDIPNRGVQCTGPSTIIITRGHVQVQVLQLTWPKSCPYKQWSGSGPQIFYSPIIEPDVLNVLSFDLLY